MPAVCANDIFLKRTAPPVICFPLAENLELFCKHSRKNVLSFLSCSYFKIIPYEQKNSFYDSGTFYFFLFFVVVVGTSSSFFSISLWTEERKYQCCFLSLGKSFLQTLLAFHDFRASVLNGMEESYLVFKFFFSDFENVKESSKSLFLRFVKGFLIPWI